MKSSIKLFLNDCIVRKDEVNESGKKLSVYLPIEKPIHVSRIHIILDSSKDLKIQYSVDLKSPNAKPIPLGKVTSCSCMLQYCFKNGKCFKDGLYELVFTPLAIEKDLHDKMTFVIEMYD